MSYLWCLYQRGSRTWVSLEAFRAIEAALVKHDNNMKDYSWWLTDHHNHNHSNYLVCDRAKYAVCHCQESGKLQLNYCNALVIAEFTISSCSEGRTRDVHSSSLLIDVYALFSDVSLRRQASMTQAEKFLISFCSRAMLICSIIWLGKRMLRVVVLRFCSSLTWGCPVFSVADLYCLKLFLR